MYMKALDIKPGIIKLKTPEMRGGRKK